MENREEFKSAKSKALRYLSYRDRSFIEVHTYLNRKGFSKSAISKTLDYFTEHDYINDERFAPFLCINGKGHSTMTPIIATKKKWTKNYNFPV